MGHQVAVTVYDGVPGYELGIVTEAFGLARPGLEHLDYELALHRTEPGPLRTSHGLRIVPDCGTRQLMHVETVVVPGWRDTAETPPSGLLRGLADAHRNGARVVGICSGAFPLAHAGLLDDQTATTHWLYADSFRRQFPHIKFDPDSLYVLGTNNTATSAGSSAGLDLCLALIAIDHSPADAAQIAQRMVVSHHRPGTQAQFMPHDRTPPPSDGPLGDITMWIDANLQAELTIETLAEHANLSRRTLIRRFNDLTGTSPHAWITGRRVQLARQLLESSQLSVEQVARRTGLGTPANLRKHLARATGLTPSQYRRQHQHPKPIAPLHPQR